MCLSWLRSVKFSDCTNLVAAMAAAASAYLALKSVQAANEQVKVALTVVNRGEYLKALSEFSNAAHVFCTSLVPPELRDKIIIRWEIEDKPIDPETLYFMMNHREIKDDEIAKMVENNDKKSNAENLDLNRKTQSLLIWIEDENKRNQLQKFINNIYRNSEPTNLRPETRWNITISRKFSRCEHIVNEKVKELIK